MTRYALSERATGDLLALIHKLSEPHVVDQTRRLPRSARTLSKHVHETASSNLVTDNLDLGSVINTELTAAAGAISETFYHFDVQAVIQSLLSSVEMDRSKMNFQYQRRCVVATGERIYDEIHSGDWWRDCEIAVRANVPHASILSVILYVDGVAVDFFGRMNLIPVVLTLGNFSTEQRQTLEAKRLVGFVPSLTETQIRSLTTRPSSAVRRELLHAAFARYRKVDAILGSHTNSCPCVMRRILERITDIQQQGGITASVDAAQLQLPETLYPVLTVVCCDNKDAVALASIKAGQTPMPCRHCTCSLGNLNAFQEMLYLPPRDVLRASNAVSRGDREYCTQHSIHSDLQVRMCRYYFA